MQLMAYHTLPIVRHNPIYVAGDSHSMPPAWHTIQVKDTPRLLHPMLVTGLKIWHMRPESKFYPKKNFECVIDSSKQKMIISFLWKFWMIFSSKWQWRDFFVWWNWLPWRIPRFCRKMSLWGKTYLQNLLWQQFKVFFLKNLEEAVTVTVNIYIDILLKLIKTKKFRIFIHPTVPLLNETR